MADWWADFFDDTLAEMFLVRADEGELTATLAFLTERLALGSGSMVFDQCCGIGSLSIPLARRGIRVVGVDQCAAYVERARRESAGLPATYEVGDALAFTPAGPCDGAFNWYSSFGYAET